MKKWKPFSKWTVTEVEHEFQLQEQTKNYSFLVNWLRQINELSPQTKAILDVLKEELVEYSYGWNEEELRIKFIAKLLDMVKFDALAYKSFFEREILITYKNQPLAGQVDFVVARGKYVPEIPYFFLHEHKREANSSDDPRGQLLVAMVTAQLLNQDGYPIYGAYIIGRAWYFVVLQGQEYAVSLAYDATKDDIYQLYGILQHTRQLIDERVSQALS